MREIRGCLGIGLPLADAEFEWDVDRHVQETFTVQDAIAAVREHEDSLNQRLLRISQPDLQFFGDLQYRLEQELFRAWKRKFPDDSKPYETLGSDSEEAQGIVKRQHLALVKESDWIPTKTQRAILSALDGCALTADELENATDFARSTIFHKTRGIGELQERRLVLNDRKIGGYYRPDTPPIQ